MRSPPGAPFRNHGFCALDSCRREASAASSSDKRDLWERRGISTRMRFSCLLEGTVDVILRSEFEVEDRNFAISPGRMPAKGSWRR
jgi:hypothetical protein